MSKTTKTVLRSDDLNCPSCIAKIEKALGGVAGVREARVRFNSGKVEIDHDAGRATPEALIEVVRDAGYNARVSAF